MFAVKSHTSIGTIVIRGRFRTHRDASRHLHDIQGRLHARFGFVLHVGLDRTDFVDDFRHVQTILGRG